MLKKLGFLEADMSLLLSAKYIIVHEVFIDPLEYVDL